MRHYGDWLTAYTQYASYSEAPPRMHFWSGVSAIAGALRRKVWVPMGYFSWFPNFYIVLVAPPGIVSKSTTAAIAMNLLRKVPGVVFGPDVVTWPALVTAFAGANEAFEYNDGIETTWMAQCALTLESSEFGNLVNPADRDMIDLLVNLWDSKQGAFTKVTKGNGTDQVENPFINLIACTTPAWIAGNFPEYVVGGGFTSRCLFIYAEEKAKLIAYPLREMPKDLDREKEKLIEDLVEIAKITGPYKLSEDAYAYGKEWYKYHYANRPPELDDDRFGGYIARKQTHIHKTALVLAAAQRDDRTITRDDLAMANTMVTDLELDMAKVFARIGRTEVSVQAERFIRFVHKRGSVSYAAAYAYVHSAFPDARNFEAMVKGAQSAGFISIVPRPGGNSVLVAKLPEILAAAKST